MTRSVRLDAAEDLTVRSPRLAMELHASCAVRDGAGVLLLGPSGSGKSGLLLRLLHEGFDLVADDRVVLEGGVVRPRDGGEGLLEIRGVGIVRLPHVARARLRLAVHLSHAAGARLPDPERPHVFDVPSLDFDPSCVATAARIRAAVDCLLGRIEQVSGFVVE